ncbi:PAS domain-containing protein [Streptomyces sp. NPDC002573]|uniref:PAS domain-containing protein n=1 Tax=Streptomyces sp. NPDC002573 TaxID=3364651 RepID=UPI0036748F6F
MEVQALDPRRCQPISSPRRRPGNPTIEHERPEWPECHDWSYAGDRTTIARGRQVDASDELLRKAEPSALLYPDGNICSLNAAMATALGRPAEQCVGRYMWDLVPESQRTVVECIVAHASKQRLAMRVLDFPGRAGRLWSPSSRRGRSLPSWANSWCGCTRWTCTTTSRAC